MDLAIRRIQSLRHRPVLFVAACVTLTTLSSMVAGAQTPERWIPTVIDGGGGSAGRIEGEIADVSATRAFGSVHLFYTHWEAMSLRHAWREDGSWKYQTLDGLGGAGGRTDHDVSGPLASARLGSALHIFYRDQTTKDLRHGWATEGTGGWRFETLDGAGGPDGRVDAELGFDTRATAYDDHLYVFYAVATSGDLRAAVFRGGRWRFRTLDGDRITQGRTDAVLHDTVGAVVFDDRLHVFYSALTTVPMPDGRCCLWELRRASKRSGHPWNVGAVRLSDGEAVRFTHHTTFATMNASDNRLFLAGLNVWCCDDDPRMIASYLVRREDGWRRRRGPTGTQGQAIELWFAHVDGAVDLLWSDVDAGLLRSHRGAREGLEWKGEASRSTLVDHRNRLHIFMARATDCSGRFPDAPALGGLVRLRLNEDAELSTSSCL